MSRVSDDSPAQFSWMGCALFLAWCLMLGSMAIQAYTIHLQSSTITVQSRVIKNYEAAREDWICSPMDSGRGFDYKLCWRPKK